MTLLAIYSWCSLATFALLCWLQPRRGSLDLTVLSAVWPIALVALVVDWATRGRA